MSYLATIDSGFSLSLTNEFYRLKCLLDVQFGGSVRWTSEISSLCTKLLQKKCNFSIVLETVGPGLITQVKQ